jgi:4-diphosphocytidyl-2-C-methyl-D-erythritol kinase
MGEHASDSWQPQGRWNRVTRTCRRAEGAVPRPNFAMTRLQTLAPAKINLTLCVLTRRSDDYHDLSSLVAFAEVGDEVALETGSDLDLAVAGPLATAAGDNTNNLILKAARAMQARCAGLKLGHFHLVKRLPAGAGLGGGSADAAAALRLIAQANDIDLSDKRVMDAARATGADVPVCVESKARLMHGVGDVLSSPLKLPKLDALLVFPGVPIVTKDVFGNFTLLAGPRRKTRYEANEIPTERAALLDYLAREANDLELAARLVAPEISEAKDILGDTDARVVRMSGSGSAVFALYETVSLAKRAAAKIKKRRPEWWCMQTVLA